MNNDFNYNQQNSNPGMGYNQYNSSEQFFNAQPQEYAEQNNEEQPEKKSGCGKIAITVIAVILIISLAVVLLGIAAVIGVLVLGNIGSDKTPSYDVGYNEETTAYNEVTHWFGDDDMDDKNDMDDAIGIIIPDTKIEIASAKTIYGDVLPASNEDSSRSFDADRVIDGNPESCWCVNTENTGGVDAEMKIYLKENCAVNGMKIINGNIFKPEEDIYISNGQAKELLLTFADGSEILCEIPYNEYADDSFCTIYFDYPIITDSVTITVTDSYTGAKYTTNVCIGEIAFF